MSGLPIQSYYTIEDYNRLTEEGGLRYQLEDGLLLMSPSPSGSHQRLLLKLGSQLEYHFKDGECWVFPDFDVQLFPDEDTIYCPDLLVLCDKLKYTERKIIGAPNFIIEIFSPSTGGFDLSDKREQYQRAGVKEYWVVRSPNLVYTYLLNSSGHYEETIYRNKASIAVRSFTGLTLSFDILQK
ncbi:MAG: Uma2 family endonuclease [Spirochaetaceae bacterium]|nr:Uma2 family endonuclease [Spirochaetaceae bacterium]